MFTGLKLLIFVLVFNKVKAILFLLVYLPAVIGVGFSAHYCGGELQEVKVFSTAKISCCDEETEAQNGCCDDEIKLVKLEESHNLAAKTPTPQPSLALVQQFIYTLVLAPVQQVKTVQIKESPPLLKIPIIVRHSQFII